MNLAEQITEQDRIAALKAKQRPGHKRTGEFKPDRYEVLKAGRKLAKRLANKRWRDAQVADPVYHAAIQEKRREHYLKHAPERRAKANARNAAKRAAKAADCKREVVQLKAEVVS